MPRKKPFILTMEEIYRNDKIDDWIFSYIQGAQKVLPSLSLKQAALLFIEDFGMFEDSMPLSNVLMSYYRTLKKYRDERKRILIKNKNK